MRRWSNHYWFRWWFDAWSAPSHYLNQCWNIVNWTLRNKLQWNLNRNSNIFIHENALESVVCEMTAILSRPQCVIATGYGVSFVKDLQTNDHISKAFTPSVVTLVIMLTQYIPRIIDTIGVVLYFVAVKYRPVSPIFFWVSSLALTQAWHCHSANDAAQQILVEILHGFDKDYDITKSKIHIYHVDISWYVL